MTTYQEILLTGYNELNNSKYRTADQLVVDSSDYGRLKPTLDFLVARDYIYDLDVNGGHVYILNDGFDFFEEHFRAEIGEPMPEIVKLIDMIPAINKLFSASFGCVDSIFSDEKFISWKNQIIYELNKLKQDPFIIEINSLFDSMIGWNDKKQFKEITSRLMLLKQNLQDYVIKGDHEQSMHPEKSNKKVFIVHGHDEKLKYEMATWLSSLDLEPIILHLQANMGIKTIINKIAENSDVCCAIVLMTADDLGKEKAEEYLKPRARQNVVFEAGYFLGKLGDDHVILLYDNGLEAPGDLAGCIYIEADPYGGWKEQVRTEFKAMGIEYSK